MDAKMKTIVCPQCANHVPQPGNIRCPRCNALLLTACEGNCRRCRKNKGCNG